MRRAAESLRHLARDFDVEAFHLRRIIRIRFDVRSSALGVTAPTQHGFFAARGKREQEHDQNDTHGAHVNLRRVNRDLQLALDLAGAADAITMRWFRSSSLEVRTKADRSPVSAADEETERMIREKLQRERPGDGIVGEEFGVSGDAARRWIVDAIDATKNYIRGIPVFATLIALEENGTLIVGVVSSPAMQKRWWASKGDGAFCNDARMHVSSVDAIEKAYMSYDSVS